MIRTYLLSFVMATITKYYRALSSELCIFYLTPENFFRCSSGTDLGAENMTHNAWT